MYKDRLASAGLYYAQLVDRAKVLKALNTPKLGDSLIKPDGTPWMGDLAHMAPKLNWDDLSQTAALPLGSWLKTDPWDDKVHMLNAKRYAPMNARDKMPFEVTPIFYKLQRYEAANVSRPCRRSRGIAGQRTTGRCAGQYSAGPPPAQSTAGAAARARPATGGGTEPADIIEWVCRDRTRCAAIRRRTLTGSAI